MARTDHLLIKGEMVKEATWTTGTVSTWPDAACSCGAPLKEMRKTGHVLTKWFINHLKQLGYEP